MQYRSNSTLVQLSYGAICKVSNVLHSLMLYSSKCRESLVSREPYWSRQPFSPRVRKKCCKIYPRITDSERLPTSDASFKTFPMMTLRPQHWTIKRNKATVHILLCNQAYRHIFSKCYRANFGFIKSVFSIRRKVWDFSGSHFYCVLLSPGRKKLWLKSRARTKKNFFDDKRSIKSKALMRVSTCFEAKLSIESPTILTQCVNFHFMWHLMDNKI